MASTAISDARLTVSGLPVETRERFRFSTWKPTKGLGEAWAIAEAYSLNPFSRPLLLMAGPPGVGKTHLALAVAWQLLEEGTLVTYRQCGSLLDTLKGLPRFVDNGSPPYYREVRFLEEVPVLILDDLGQQRDWEFIDSLVDFRYLRMRPIIGVTNLAVGELPQRLVSRFSDKATSMVVTIKARDYRAVRDK